MGSVWSIWAEVRLRGWCIRRLSKGAEVSLSEVIARKVSSMAGFRRRDPQDPDASRS
jgi:lambda repressor-like predicted transcriptional regulator